MVNHEKTSFESNVDWDDLSRVEFPATNRQQRKIIAGLLTGDYDGAISEHDADVSSETEEAFLDKLASGEIGLDDERKFLLRINDPIHTKEIGRDQMYREVTASPYEKWILAYMLGYDANNWQSVDEVDVAKFVHDYPTPIDFVEKAEFFLKSAKTAVSEKQYEAYEEAMKEFQLSIYGKRYEYWVQMQELNERAEGREVSEKVETVVELKEPSLISRELKEALVANARVDGDTYLYGGKEYRLTPEALDSCNLGPKYEVSVEGHQICLSDIFQMERGRLAAIAYVPGKDGVKVRGYYKSNSQGTWRYLPDYVSDGNDIAWYGKSSNEEALTLPLKLQESLAYIEDKGLADIGTTVPGYLLGGTAYRYGSKDEYMRCLYSGQMRGDFYREVSASPAIEFGQIRSDTKQPPETLKVNSRTAPDFSRAVASFGTVSTLAGKITMEGYRSEDGNFEWNFCQDKNGRAWVGGLEVVSPITSLGLRKEWASAGDFATPLYEYESQAVGYGDESDTVGVYQSMWRNYLSKVPLIQDYLRAKNTK